MTAEELVEWNNGEDALAAIKKRMDAFIEAY
jgi:hypothetical protein